MGISSHRNRFDIMSRFLGCSCNIQVICGLTEDQKSAIISIISYVLISMSVRGNCKVACQSSYAILLRFIAVSVLYCNSFKKETKSYCIELA